LSLLQSKCLLHIVITGAILVRSFSTCAKRGIDTHPHLPDNSPLDSRGLPTFQLSINHFIPDQADKRAILKFIGLNNSTIQQVLNLYEHDTESHDKYGEAVFDGYMYRFPLAIRLLELYA
jgi:hypothetical protein